MQRHRSEGLTYNEMMGYCVKKSLAVRDDPELFKCLLDVTKDMLGLEFVQELKEKIEQQREINLKNGETDNGN